MRRDVCYPNESKLRYDDIDNSQKVTICWSGFHGETIYTGVEEIEYLKQESFFKLYRKDKTVVIIYKNQVRSFEVGKDVPGYETICEI